MQHDSRLVRRNFLVIANLGFLEHSCRSIANLQTNIERFKFEGVVSLVADGNFNLSGVGIECDVGADFVREKRLGSDVQILGHCLDVTADVVLDGVRRRGMWDDPSNTWLARCRDREM